MGLLVPPAFELSVPCGNEDHVIDVIDGSPSPRAHDLEQERALHILGGTFPPCVAWCDAVMRTPYQLSRFELFAMRQPARPLPPAPYLVSSMLAQGVTIDVSRMPPVLRRLAVLRHERKELRRRAHPRAYLGERTRQWVHLSMPRHHRSRSTKLIVGGASPGVRHGSSGMLNVRLPEDWLSSVFVFGLEQLEGSLTLDASITVDRADVMRLVRRRGSFVAERSRAALDPAMRLLNGARA